MLELDARQAEIFKQGKCKGINPDVFFPITERSGGRYPKGQAIRDRDSVEGAQLRAAEICNGVNDGMVCPVRATCLEFALDTRQKDGVWGGQTEMALQKIRSQRRINAN